MSSDFTYVQDVKLFHDKFGLQTPESFTRLEDELHKFRTGFFREELKEYTDAVRDADLATTFDSLIDLIYIISGAALLHGVQHAELYAAMAVVDDFFADDAVLRDGIVGEVNAIGLPELAIASIFETLMADHIASYDMLHQTEELSIEERHMYVKLILAAMFNSCLTAAAYQGCTEDLWNELWADVQRANMSKERALKASDSKRGSTYDVIKPVGWVGPRTDEIIAKHKTLAAS